MPLDGGAASQLCWFRIGKPNQLNQARARHLAWDRIEKKLRFNTLSDSGEVKMQYRAYLPVLSLLFSATTALSQGPAPQQELFGEKRVLLNSKFIETPSVVLTAGVAPGSAYGSVRYAVGTSAQKEYLRKVFTYMSETLPEKFGNSSGAYTITITIKDNSGKEIAKEPIISFEWSKERGFLFVEKTIIEVQKTSWKGTLIDRMPLRDGALRLKVGIEVYHKSDRSVDFELLKKTSKLFSDGALAAVMPLPAAAASFIAPIGELINAFYAGSKKETITEDEEFVFDGKTQKMKAPVTFVDDEGRKVTVPIELSIETEESRLTGGKFDASKISEEAFANATVPLIGGKTVTVLELLLTGDSKSAKEARPMLDAVTSGGAYGKDPNNKKEVESVNSRCGALYDALHAIASAYDARALFWAFLKRNGDKIDRNVCLGSRKGELDKLGLVL